jgi:hypothetical protein
MIRLIFISGKPTNRRSRGRGKHANHYTIDAVAFSGIVLGQMRVFPDVVCVLDI